MLGNVKQIRKGFNLKIWRKYTSSTDISRESLKSIIIIEEHSANFQNLFVKSFESSLIDKKRGKSYVFPNQLIK